MARARDSKGRFKKGRSRRKSSRKRSSRGKTCKVVTVCGKKRRICWGASGIVSNVPAGSRRSGSKRKSSKRKSSSSSSKGWKMVSRSAATKRNGRLKKGCKFVKGGGALCKK